MTGNIKEETLLQRRYLSDDRPGICSPGTPRAILVSRPTENSGSKRYGVSESGLKL
jgi:hypothetical protein